ncbi:MAG: hypothetical protein AAF517_18620 [Planctomycetota bacterium]
MSEGSLDSFLKLAEHVATQIVSGEPEKVVQRDLEQSGVKGDAAESVLFMVSVACEAAVDVVYEGVPLDEAARALVDDGADPEMARPLIDVCAGVVRRDEEREEQS